MAPRTNRMIRAFALIAAANATHAIGQTTDDRLCADQNADGMVIPADFTAWISAFNMGEIGPGCTVDLGDGGHVSGTIPYVGDVDTFTVNADAGNGLSLTISENPNTSASRYVGLHGPSGQLPTSDWASSGFTLNYNKRPATGRYTYVVHAY